MSDLISRQAAIDVADAVWSVTGDKNVAKVWDQIKDLPSAQPVVISKSENTTECEDAVSREAVLNEIHRYMEERDYTIGLLDDNVCGLPPVTPKQPGQRNARVFQGIIVEYPSISAYPEYEGKPYFSIKYTENGQGFIGYGTYKPEVLSEYLKEYFMPPAQQTTLTADDIETIRIHLSAFKEKLCNQGRWTEAAEYERLIQRLTGKGGQDEEKDVR